MRPTPPGTGVALEEATGLPRGQRKEGLGAASSRKGSAAGQTQQKRSVCPKGHGLHRPEVRRRAGSLPSRGMGRAWGAQGTEGSFAAPWKPPRFPLTHQPQLRAGSHLPGLCPQSHWDGPGQGAAGLGRQQALGAEAAATQSPGRP